MRVKIFHILFLQNVMKTQCLCKSFSTYSRLGQIYSTIKNSTYRTNAHFHPKDVLKFTQIIKVPTKNLATDLQPEEFSIRVTVSQIKRFLQAKNLSYEEGYTCFRLHCPFCSCTHGLPPKPPELGSFFINMTTGMFICYSCKQLGNWRIFVDYINIREMQNSEDKEKLKLPRMENSLFLNEEDREKLSEMFNNAIFLSTYNHEQLLLILSKFRLKSLDRETLKKFQIKISTDEKSILFPFYDPDKQLSSIKIHSLDEKNDIKEAMFPKQSFGLFGYSTLAKSVKDVVLTASPADSLAVCQETNTAAIALPQGLKNLSPEILPLFEKFHRVTLWLGDSINDWEMAKVFARKLSEKRCFFIRPREDQPAALIALQNRLNLLPILKGAQPISHKSITTFETIRQDVLDELSHAEQVAGMKWKRYPGLNRLLKGHRRGELTVLTGPTGSGKTTFMSEYSLDLCMQGMSTLWGSFEIKNVRLAKMMLTQFSLLPLDKNLDQFDVWADKFEQIPLYLMTFHGQQSIPHVLDAMSHAVYVHDIQHVIVDNVQFMLGIEASSSKLDRFHRQDLLISAFRKFATQNNCHVSLVIHPRKEREMEDLNNSSIFGGAKASQEADNIIILQDKRLSMLRGRKFLQVTKNRFDGDIGIVPLDFDKETLSFMAKKKPRKIGETKTESTSTTSASTEDK